MDHLDETSTTSRISFYMQIAGQIHLRGVPPQMRASIKNYLKLINPTYQQAIRTNPRAKYVLSEYINYYEENKTTGDLCLPRGIEAKVRAYARRCKIQINEDDSRVRRPLHKRLRTSIKLRPYQEGISSIALKRCSGIFRLAPGLGKTPLGIKVIEEIQQKTLIIVPKLDLLNQWVKELKKFSGYKAGIIQGKNFEVKDITVATIQSLKNRIKDGLMLPDQFGCLIVDECHLFVPPKSRKAIQFFSPKHLYGLTGTCDRSDGQGTAIEWIFGEKLCDIDSKSLKPKVVIVLFTGHIWVQEYAQMIKEQVENEDRNALIVDTIKEEMKTGAKILVLTKRVKQYAQIAKQIDSDGIIQFHASQKTQERNELLTGLREGTHPFKVIFGTFGLLSTGINIPILDTLVIAGDLKSEVLSTQSVGRILRIVDGKTECKIIDIFDKNNKILRRQGLLRQAFYKKNGWEIEELLK